VNAASISSTREGQRIIAAPSLEEWPKAITVTEDRFNILAAIIAKFRPKPVDVHIQGTRANLSAVAPDHQQESVSGNEFTCFLDQDGQQLILLTTQDHRA
jgi:hypothetical protein